MLSDEISSYSRGARGCATFPEPAQAAATVNKKEAAAATRRLPSLLQLLA
ncbi:MAG: hypothetical protein HC773_03125 [Scytonema sp. CRU_2_7]|nr:hypothetical protein [Scytonema sp. CRU_2_7]